MENKPYHNHDGNIEALTKHMPPDRMFSISANIMKLLSDTTRLKILWILSHSEQCVTDISFLINMSLPAVSHHLRSLKQTGVIESRRDGKEVYYKISQTNEGTLVRQIVLDICHCEH